MKVISRKWLGVSAAAVTVFLFTTADSCSGSGSPGSGGGGGSNGPPASSASTVTGSIAPSTLAVGDQVALTFDLSGFNQNISDFGLDFSGDFGNHNVIDGVTITGGGSGACAAENPGSTTYHCGSFDKSAQVEVVATATAKDAGNWNDTVTFQTGSAGGGNWAIFDGSNSSMQVQETVNP
jgi:hypothetical protein